MLKSSKALQFLFLVGLATTVIGIPALLLFVVALRWIFLIYPAVFLGLVLLVSYIAAICMLYDDIFGSGRDQRFLEAEVIPIPATKFTKVDKNTIVKTPYDLFIMWIYDRVFIARPTDTRYLQDVDWKVLDRIYDKYGWFTKGHCFTIGAKGTVEYHHSSPDDITNIDGAYNKAHGSVTKLRSNFKGFSFGRSDKNSIRYMMNWAQDRTDKLLTELADNFLEEKHRSRNIARNTKFVVREMTGMSNKDYKAFLKKFKEKEVARYDETSQCFEDILKISSLEFDHEVILEAVDVYNRNVYHLNRALLKLKEKLNEGR